jgi:hypothetical protein
MIDTLLSGRINIVQRLSLQLIISHLSYNCLIPKGNEHQCHENCSYVLCKPAYPFLFKSLIKMAILFATYAWIFQVQSSRNISERHYYMRDRLCGLVVRVPGYRSRSPGSIPDAADFLKSNGSGTGSTQPREYS